MQKVVSDPNRGQGYVVVPWSSVRFPVMLLKFYVEIIFPDALWLWSRLRLYQKHFLGVKAAGVYG
jgi:hypothetical protein